MEAKDRTLIGELSLKHSDVKALWDDHILYEKQIEKLEKKNFLNPDEDVQLKQLKKQKLEGKTKLVELLKKYAK